MKVETGQLRWWTLGHKLGPFLILEHEDIGGGAWWILSPQGKDWEPNDEIEEHSKAISENR